MLKISKILMDYETEQCGITHMPQFGWILESDKRNVMQEAYELEIAGDAAFTDFIYQSGKTESDASAQVEVQGVELKSVTKYYVRVRAWVAGEESAWAEASFVTGLMNNSEWKASFITAETKADASNSKSTCLRKEFTVDGKVKEAYVCTTALGLYNFYLNGKKVGTDELTPGWTSYLKHLCYQTYDVTDYLKEGKNAAGAILGAGWFKGTMSFLKHRNNYGDRTAFLA